LRQKNKATFRKNAIPFWLEILRGKRQGNCVRERALVPRVPPPNAGASSLTLLISIFHQVLWHISNFHLGKIITQQLAAAGGTKN
jgi:hypothetical protein